MEAGKFGFEDLELWKKAREFKNEVCHETRSFPTEEKFRLTDQIIRSSRGINALIAEGHGRFSYPIKYIFVCRQEAHYLKRSTILLMRLIKRI
jgi:four helix bundle protein